MKKYKNTSRAVMFLFALLLSANSCIEIGKVIAVKSNTAENITSTGAELSATVVDIGETGLSSYGWCWSENQNPSTSDNIYDFGTKDNVGDYSFLLTGLDPGKNYYARSFVSGSGETVYGEELEIVTEALIFTISSPGQGDILGYDMTYQIEWIANISDKLKIELFQNNTLAETIADETDNSESFNWTVANTIAESNDYHILISSVKNNEVKAETGNFSILAEAPPNVQTDSINNVTFNSVTAFGMIINFGTDNFANQHGFCWSINENPDILDNKIELGSTATKGGFSGNLIGLEPITTYYVRAFATNNVGASYGEEISFTTENVFAPSVSTGTASNISHNSATVDGAINDFGTDDSATQHGHCWGLSQTPTITDNKTELGTTNTVGNFSSNLSNLDDNTTYYIRAYATNNVGTSYGEEVSFTTENVYAPSVSTGVASNIVYNSATMEGTINDFGTDNSATQHGHCWSLSSNPTIANSKTELGATSTTGSYSSNLTSLESITTYYVRAYATNNVGASYGTEVSFTTTKLPVPDITTSAVSDISYTTATCGGDVTNDNGYTVTARGVCWSISPNPTLSDDFTTDGTGTGVFSSSITGLSENTTYYVRAYATNSLGTAYGNQQEFTSLVASTPTVATTAVSNVSFFTATSGGNVTNENGSSVTARGVCWSISQNPTITDNHTTDGSGTGTFSSSITGLTDNTTYYVRAYATNGHGTTYGNQLSFTSLKSLPTVFTDALSNISYNSATSGGNVTYEGASAVTSRGVCWSTSQNPTLSDNNTTDGSSTGTFQSDMTGLSDNTTYYVRAYASNGMGTSYGEQRSYTTDIIPLPILTTSSVINISYNIAASGGDITSDNGYTITASGVCWGTSPSPTLSGNFTTDGSGTGIYSSELLGLIIGTTYYVRAYATSSIGTAYGNERSFSTLPAHTTVTDYDGNTYNAVLIGSQVWMAENLKTIHYADGRALVNGTGIGDSDYTTKYFFNYNDDVNNVNTYGRLYTWAAAMDGGSSSETNPSGIQGVCPTGWHLPSDAEWKELEMYLGMSQAEADGTYERGTDEGDKLKEAGLTYWFPPSIGEPSATNEYGFSGRGSGLRSDDLGGYFQYFKQAGYFWTTSYPAISNRYWCRQLGYNSSGIYRYYRMGFEGLSIRCVRD